MIAKNRMDKIAKDLTPQQVVLGWIGDKMRRFNSFHELGEWQIDQPCSEAPLNKMADLVCDAVRAAVKGQSKAALIEAEQRAVREAHFLVRLFINVNEKLVRDATQFDLEAKVILLRLRRLAEYRRKGEEFYPRSDGSVASEAAVSEDENGPSLFTALTEGDRLREEIVEYAMKAFLSRGVVEAMQQNYFAGQSVLFPVEAKYLDAVVKQAEFLVQQYNFWVPSNPFRAGLGSLSRCEANDAEPAEEETPPEGEIDLEKIKAAAATNVRRDLAFAVRMAQAETLAGFGMNEDGARLGREAFHKHYGPSKA